MKARGWSKVKGGVKKTHSARSRGQSPPKGKVDRAIDRI